LDIISDITKIPVKKSSFDAIMCTKVFEHIINPELAVKEFSRIIKKNGYLLITAPFCSLTHFAPYHFSTGFNKYYYQEVLSKNGFKILEISQNGNYFTYLIQELNRTKSVAKKYSSSFPNIIEMICIKVIIKMLKRISKNEVANSGDLLCFGYNILAKKVK
jgi:ubiquinone/menaquinone biosynthesis C-methylase UbiE